jgi:hypothetical protein
VHSARRKVRAAYLFRPRPAVIVHGQRRRAAPEQGQHKEAQKGRCDNFFHVFSPFLKLFASKAYYLPLHKRLNVKKIYKQTPIAHIEVFYGELGGIFILKVLRLSLLHLYNNLSLSRFHV